MSGYFNAAAHVSVVPEPAAIFFYGFKGIGMAKGAVGGLGTRNLFGTMISFSQFWVSDPFSGP